MATVVLAAYALPKLAFASLSLSLSFSVLLRFSSLTDSLFPYAHYIGNTSIRTSYLYSLSSVGHGFFGYWRYGDHSSGSGLFAASLRPVIQMELLYM